MGYIVHKMLMCSLGRLEEDDRDHFGKKRQWVCVLKEDENEVKENENEENEVEENEDEDEDEENEVEENEDEDEENDEDEVEDKN